MRAYYAHVAPDDLSDRSDLDLYGAAVAHWNLARVRQPGESKVHVYTPNVEEHGWESPHTVVETVVDDMPFLVDSVSMEVTRNGSAIHLVVRPIMRVRRDEEGRLLEVGAEDGQPESMIHVEIDRQAGPGELEQLRADLCARARRRAGRRRGVADDARAHPRRARGARRVATARRPGRARGGARPARVDARRPLHVPRLPRVRHPHRRRGGGVARGAGLGPRHPARGRRADDLGQLRPAAAGGAAAGAREEPPHADEGKLAGDCAPALVPRLRRRQALRRRRRGRRRMALPRPLHAHGVQREPVGDPRPAPQGAARHRAVGPADGQPRSQGARRDPRDVPSRRAVPDLGGRALRDGARHSPSRRAPARAALRAPGRVRTLPLVPRLRAAGAVRHREPAADPGDPPAGVRRARASTSRRVCPSRCWRASTSSSTPSRARRRSSTSPRSRRGSPRRREPGRTISATRWRSSSARPVPARSSSATARRSRAPTGRTSPPARRCTTSSGSSGSTRTATSG